MERCIRIGAWNVNDTAMQIIQKACRPSCAPVQLRRLSDILDFLASKTFPSGRVLVLNAELFSSDAGALEMIGEHLHDADCHVLILRESDAVSIPDFLLSCPSVHVLTGETSTLKDLLIRECRVIRSHGEPSSIESVVPEMLQFYEATYATEAEPLKRPPKLIDKVAEVLHASSVSVFLLNTVMDEYRLELQTGSPPIQSISRQRVDQNFQFSNACQTYTSSQFSGSNPLSISSSVTSTIRVTVVSTFLLEGLPGFVLYTFPEQMDEGLLWDLCTVISREIFHILRGTRVLARSETLAALVQLRVALSTKTELFWNALEHLKKYFRAEGLSIVELTGSQANLFTFTKTYIHHGRKDVDNFQADHGYAVQSIINKKALLITKTFDSASPPYGTGYEYDPEDLGVDRGREIRIEYIRSPRTIEDESCVIYYPLIHEEDLSAALKVSLFSGQHAFDLRHLRDLELFARPIAALLAHIRAVESLKIRIANASFHEEIGRQAETLFFYRDIALGVFHQLGTHLETARQALDLLEIRPSRTSSTSADLKELVQEGKTAVLLAKDLVSDAHMRGLTLEPLKERCFLVRDVLRPAIKYAQDKLKGSGIDIDHALTNEDYPVVLDPKLARESIINILNNAIWAIRENPRAGKREVFVALRKDPDSRLVHVEVTDSGIGMDRDRFEKAARFEPFNSSRRNGTGLGLYFTHRLMAHFDGSITIPWSQPGKGTTVVIAVPVAEEGKT